jgi:NifU-like protein involved in Fe-S cluster formation
LRGASHNAKVILMTDQHSNLSAPGTASLAPAGLEARIRQAIQNPQNLGEMVDADSVGTVGSPDCGDMLRMWVKFKLDDRGRKVIDRATFQTFGCETAIAVASVATELISGKTVEEALGYSGSELAAPLGPLPPMKIHCAQLVEGALRSALQPVPAGTVDNAASDKPGVAAVSDSKPTAPTAAGSTLVESFQAPAGGRVKLRPKE